MRIPLRVGSADSQAFDDKVQASEVKRDLRGGSNVDREPASGPQSVRRRAACRTSSEVGWESAAADAKSAAVCGRWRASLASVVWRRVTALVQGPRSFVYSRAAL